MKIVIDNEFNGYKGQLISMALVTESGEEFYEVLEHGPGMMAVPTEPLDPWVVENVLPVLDKPDFLHLDVAAFQHRLAEFLNQYDDCPYIEIIADWPDDIKYLCQALITGPGKKITTPPMRFRILDDVKYQPAVPHNALSDARAIAAVVFRDHQKKLAGLTNRERQVYDYVLDEFTNREISDFLSISPRTVELHRGRVMKKMGAKSAIGLAKQEFCR